MSDGMNDRKGELTMKNSNTAILVAAVALILSIFFAYNVRLKHSCVDSGHNFVARYDKVMPDKAKIDATKDLWMVISKAENARGGIDLKYEEIYRGDVCAYCGDSNK